MSKATKIAAGLAVVPMLAFAAPAMADSSGTFGTAPDQYQVKNANSSTYGTSASVDACGELNYRVRLDNVAYGAISNITVKVNLPSASATTNTSTMTATGMGANGVSTSTNGSVTVSLSSAQTISLETGTTQLTQADHTLIKNLPDTITGDGVNVGDLAGSATEFVTFKAKVSCPPQQPKQIQVCDLTTKKVVTINESDFNSSKYSKDLTQCQTTPTVLPNTGAGNVVGIVAGAVVAGFVASRLYLSRKLSR